MSRYFKPNIAAMTGYVPGEQPRGDSIIKLNTNENPYPPSPRVLAALRKATNGSLRLYPQPLSDTLRAAAAKVYGVRPENIIAGNGSDEILTMLLRSFVGPGDRVAFPVPTYSLYDTLIEIQDGVRAAVDYPSDFSLPESLAAQNAALTFLCNPNAPSGTLAGLQEIEQLARKISGILVVDEAYVDFAGSEGASSLPLIRRLPNLVVLRSFSKSFSLAGMRIGLGFAPEELISGMMKVKDSYNVNRLSMVAATAALQDIPWMTRNVRRIQSSRNKLTSGLKRLGYHVYPSQANFILAQMKGVNLKGVYEALKRNNILVRYFEAPGLEDCLRISVGAPQEMKALMKELEAIDRTPPP
ncbi:MAG: histidinol-phosphate transaminase [Deltaproteobacteria bacterium]|nr:histidinol-phosphate transaminase [Deltaproteobacteria bacterium]MDZ4343677.1 histidinol-phosphate transaminase [Candidatus Binatia bacterium]